MSETKALEVTKKELNKLSRKELLKIAEIATMHATDPEAYKNIVRQNMPEFVREMETKEAMGTSVMESTQEFMLVMADCLRRYHGWSDTEIKQLHRELTDVLMGAAEYEDAGLSMLSAYDIKRLGNQIEAIGPEDLIRRIAETRFKKAKMMMLGEEVPILTVEEAFPKQLEKKKPKKKEKKK